MKASGRGYTTADLHGLPEGRRWELIEGSLTVSPTGTIDHNAVASWIALAVEKSVPEDYVVGTNQSSRLTTTTSRGPM
ncbi:hypothetical protein [Actinoplanes sp. NPDC049599]|uniref:hypothetical protein n=1 Tax=Actinoplanes sp. NPDC049599 TaxID=3363903 RepID=UPI0037B648A9